MRGGAPAALLHTRRLSILLFFVFGGPPPSPPERGFFSTGGPPPARKVFSLEGVFCRPIVTPPLCSEDVFSSWLQRQVFGYRTPAFFPPKKGFVLFSGSFLNWGRDFFHPVPPPGGLLGAFCLLVFWEPSFYHFALGISAVGKIGFKSPPGLF